MTFRVQSSEYEPHAGLDTVQPCMTKLVRDLGLEHFSFIFLSGQGNSQPASTLYTSYPDEWVERYTRNKYWNVDPVADMARRTIRPYFWGKGPFLNKFAKQQRLVFEEADAFNIKFGLTIPIRGTAGELSVFNVVSSNKNYLEEVVQNVTGRLFSAAFDTHELVLAQSETGTARNGAPIVLSTRERECLSWTLEGKTAGEIATILGISVSTVNQHASSASNKLGSLNKHHAAVQALRLNLIQ